MPIEKRLTALEAALPAKCPKCRTLLTCSQCNDWREEARAMGLDPEQLVERAYQEMKAQLLTKEE